MGNIELQHLEYLNIRLGAFEDVLKDYNRIVKFSPAIPHEAKMIKTVLEGRIMALKAEIRRQKK